MSDRPLRYVVLRHERVADPHFDLMFETHAGGPLLTWQCSQNPLEQYVTLAKRLANHRRHYLDYEGPVSNDRGTVRRVSAGECNFVRAKGRVWILDVSGPARYEKYWVAAALRGRRWIIEGVTSDLK